MAGSGSGGIISFGGALGTAGIGDGAGTGGSAGTGGDGGGGPGGLAGTAGSAAGSGGSGGVASGGTGATAATGGGSGSGGTSGGRAGASGTGGSAPNNCNLPATVGFKKDVEPILTASCGKNTGSGCHVVDGASTTGSLCPDGTMKCGFDHAYDWITAGSHASSCPQTPNPKRFEVAIAVIDAANPSSCSKSRKMPPPGMGTPLTTCQIATLQAWLAEPMVTQLHRSDDSSLTTPYAMPPYN